MQPRLLRSPARLAGSSLLKLQSDERLVALARDGQEQAFAAIFERYRSDLERYASRLVGPTRGEDAVQQAFVNAHRSLIANPDKSIELRPWLYRIVHNAALNTLRSSRDEQPLGEDTDRLSLSDDVIERRELLREALEAVAALPPTQRDAILLRELEGRSHEEIALALGLSTGAARQQIFRARAALRAAATAITPQPLILRLMEMATASGSSGGADIATAAGGGIAAVLAKASAGVLVTGAVVGGAVGSGVVETPGHHARAKAGEAAHISSAARQARRAAAVPAATTTVSERRSGSSAGAGHKDGSRSTSTSRRKRRHRGSDSSAVTTSGPGRPKVVSRAPAAVTHHGTSNSGSGTDDGHQRGRDGGSGKGKGTSGKHGSGTSTGGEAADAPEVEAPEVETETEAAGDVSGKPATAGTSGGGGDNATTTPTAPATTAPADAGGGGQGGGTSAEALPTPSGSGGKG